jgi:hypothetical protein
VLLRPLRYRGRKPGVPAVKWKANRSARGWLVAEVLSGCWRKIPPKLQVTPSELSAIINPLVQSGTGGLVWWRLKHSPLPLPRQQWNCLKNIQRAYSLKSVVREYELSKILCFCQKNQIDPILIKGWAVARYYGFGGLRPMGDVDLCVPPERADELKAKWSTSPAVDCPVDWHHTEITKFQNLEFHALSNRANLETLADFQVRVPCLEDHLRILCLHALKHGVWRPLWLCDVAAAFEARPKNFDWDRCLGKNRTHAKWIILTLALTERLLHADVSEIPVGKLSSLPNWMVTAVLEQWNSCISPVFPAFTEQLKGSRDARTVWNLIQSRWPNPIQATVDFDGEFSERSRLPFQVRHCTRRAWDFIKARI